MTRKALALWMFIAVVGVSLGVVGLLRTSPVEATTHTATRSFSAASVLPGETLVVTINASGYGGLGDVIETLEGFTYVDGSSTVEGVEVRDGGSTLSWILTGESSFEYTVTADNEGPYSITGTLTRVLGPDDEEPEVIGGATSVVDSSSTAPMPSPSASPSPSPTPDPVQPTGLRATRSFSASSAPAGSTVDVTITAAEYGGVGEIAETLVGYAYVDSSSSLPDVEVTDGGRSLSFILTGETSLRYSVTVPSGEETHSIAGVVKNILAEPPAEAVIGGPSSIMVEDDATPAGLHATRSFSPDTAPLGGNVQVTVNATGYGGVGEVVETLVGYTYVNNSSTLPDVEVTNAGRRLKFHSDW